MKKKYALSSADEHVDMPSGWYGDVGQYLPWVNKALLAMNSYQVDLVEKFWAGEGDDEGFIEPCAQQEACAVKLEDDENGTDWTIKDGYDYEDRWQGPHFRMCMENTASLYWNAKHHDAEIALDFPVKDMMAVHTEAAPGSGQGLVGQGAIPGPAV